MTKIKIIARENIQSKPGEILSDDGLRALDGYFEDVITIAGGYNIDTVLTQYEEKHPEIKGWEIQIEELA